MKRLILIIFLLLMSPALVYADITSGLVAWWQLEENSPGATVIDSSGSGFNGTPSGPPTYVTGKIGSFALNFSMAGSQSVGMGNVLDQTTSSFTISTWINYSGTSNNFPVIMGRLQGGGGHAGYAFLIDPSGSNAFLYFDVTDGVHTDSLNLGPSLNDGLWHLATGTVDRVNQIQALYIDGTLFVSSSISSVGSLSNAISFGLGYSIGAGSFNGILDDVRVYNRALTANDVAELYGHSRGMFAMF